MRKIGKQLAALLSAAVVALSGTMCLAADEKAHFRGYIHYVDGTNVAASEEKAEAVLEEWEPYYTGLGFDREGRSTSKYLDRKYPVVYGGDIKVPVGGKVVVHSTQGDYTQAVAYGQTDLDQYLRHFHVNQEQSDMFSIRELTLKDSIHPLLTANGEPLKVYCLENEITGLKNGTGGLVHKMTNGSPYFYRIIVGNGKNEGGSGSAATVTQSAGTKESAPAEKPAASSWTAAHL